MIPASNFNPGPHRIVAERHCNESYVNPAFSQSDLILMRESIHLSENGWNAEKWEVLLPTTGTQVTVKFPEAERELDRNILRATAVRYIASCRHSTVQRIVNDGVRFLAFLQRYGLHLESVRSSIVRRYVELLEYESLNDVQRNNFLRAACALYETCEEHGLLRSNEVAIDFSFRFTEKVARRTAPDKCVTDELDRLFFDLSNDDIPLAMRCTYLLLRMIPNRISEVFGMDLECITYPDIGIFSVSIPTTKETPLHIPNYFDYAFYIDGRVESILYRLIRAQQEAVKDATKRIVSDVGKTSFTSDSSTDYLLYDPSTGRVMTAHRFNAFLSKMIKNHEIRDANGLYPTVTSHMLRHSSIGERLRSKTYSPEQTMKEANHSDLDMTLSYGHKSEHDEAEYLGNITSAVLQSELKITGHMDSTTPRSVNNTKYERLKTETPFVRIIPASGLCCNMSCHPQFGDCIVCEHFDPDIMYLEYFQEAEKIVLKRLELFRKKGGSQQALEFEMKQLSIITAYINRMTRESENEEYPEVIDFYYERREANGTE